MEYRKNYKRKSTFLKKIIASGLSAAFCAGTIGNSCAWAIQKLSQKTHIMNLVKDKSFLDIVDGLLYYFWQGDFYKSFFKILISEGSLLKIIDPDIKKDNYEFLMDIVKKKSVLVNLYFHNLALLVAKNKLKFQEALKKIGSEISFVSFLSSLKDFEKEKIEEVVKKSNLIFENIDRKYKILDEDVKINEHKIRYSFVLAKVIFALLLSFVVIYIATRYVKDNSKTKIPDDIKMNDQGDGFKHSAKDTESEKKYLYMTKICCAAIFGATTGALGTANLVNKLWTQNKFSKLNLKFKGNKEKLNFTQINQKTRVTVT